MFENVDGRTDGRRTDDGRRSHWYTNSSPRSLRLRWANKRERRKKWKLKKEGKMRISILISIYTVQFAILKMYTKFENTGSNRSWEICDRLISNMWLFFCYTIQLITIKLCTKFQSPNPSSCWEIFDGKKSLQTNRQTNKHNYRKGKNYIPPIYFVPGV